MENTQTAVAESSPAQQTFEIPSDPKANLEWRKTGELPGAAKEGQSKEESTPSKTASAGRSSEEDAAETAAASATAHKQEKAKPQNSAADRLNEILADLKKAGMTPAELKTFKREAQQAETGKTDITPAKSAETTGPETAKPQGLVAPVKPKQGDFDTWEGYEEAREKYFEDFADYKAKLAVQEDRHARAAEAQQQTLAQKVNEAKARYGEQTEATIGTAVRGIINDQGVALVVKQMLNESPVLVDVMYVLGSKPEELASFIDLAKANPGAAIRKVALLENLVEQELAHGSAAAGGDRGSKPGDAAETATTAGERDEAGKFVSQKTPAKQKPAAPPPPEELSTRASAPPDAMEAAVRNGDFGAFKDAEDRRDLARRRGA